MAVLLHVFLDVATASAVANIKLPGVVTVPFRISATADGIVLTSRKGAKLISYGGSEYTVSIGKALKGNISVAYTKLTASVFGYFTDEAKKVMNFLSSIINFALIYNTRLNILGKKELNLRFFDGAPNLKLEAKMLVRYNFAGIIFALIKILFAR